jgi:LPS export ABC transporter protein LptC
MKTGRAFGGIGMALVLSLASCSFVYEETPVEIPDLPDLVMEDLDYVRVEDGQPLVRFQAESAESYESRHTMDMTGLSFVQYTDNGSAIGAEGSAGSAQVDTASNNITLSGEVYIKSDSQDLSIYSPSLQWQNQERLLSAGPADTVQLSRSDGTAISGRGFSADARNRTWSFTDSAEGVFYFEGEDEGTAAPPEGEIPDETE